VDRTGHGIFQIPLLRIPPPTRGKRLMTNANNQYCCFFGPSTSDYPTPHHQLLTITNFLTVPGLSLALKLTNCLIIARLTTACPAAFGGDEPIADRVQPPRCAGPTAGAPVYPPILCSHCLPFLFALIVYFRFPERCRNGRVASLPTSERPIEEFASSYRAERPRL